MEVNRNRNGQNRQTQDHTDGKKHMKIQLLTMKRVLYGYKKYSHLKKIKDGTKVFTCNFCFVKEYDCL